MNPAFLLCDDLLSLHLRDNRSLPHSLIASHCLAPETRSCLLAAAAATSTVGANLPARESASGAWQIVTPGNWMMRPFDSRHP